MVNESHKWCQALNTCWARGSTHNSSFDTHNCPMRQGGYHPYFTDEESWKEEGSWPRSHHQEAEEQIPSRHGYLLIKWGTWISGSNITWEGTC